MSNKSIFRFLGQTLFWLARGGFWSCQKKVLNKRWIQSQKPVEIVWCTKVAEISLLQIYKPFHILPWWCNSGKIFIFELFLQISKSQWFFFNLYYNCSNFLDVRNLHEKHSITRNCSDLWINCSSDLKNFENSRPSASDFKSFSWSLEQFFLTVGQNNFGNKIPIFLSNYW